MYIQVPYVLRHIQSMIQSFNKAATTNYVKVQTANYILNKFMLGNLVPIKYLLSVLENKFE